MKKTLPLIAFLTLVAVFPCHAQGMANSLKGMNKVLDNVYTDMLPMCSSLIGVARGIAGFAAIFYIGVRVWKHIANAETIDFFPLFRPFVISFCILMFPSIIAVLNGILNPIAIGTNSMVADSDQAIVRLLKAKEDAMKKTDEYQMYVGSTGEGSVDKWEKYMKAAGQDPDVALGMGSDIKFAMAKMQYNMKNSIKQWIHEVLQVLYAASSLIINTIRTFFLIVMVIIGPLAFGFSVFDGFQSTLTGWISRYVNYFLWLPVANIFGAILGKIQENMLKLDLSQISNSGQTFFSETDLAYLVFMCIGIAGYFAVPSVSNFIMTAGGGQGDGFLGVANRMGGGAVGGGAAVAGAGAGAAVGAGSYILNRGQQAMSNIGSMPSNFNSGYNNDGTNPSSGSGYEAAGQRMGHAGASLVNKLQS
jgi:conjugative transposon TraJ protein